MQSDPRLEKALLSVAAERNAFRTAVAATLEQVRTMLAGADVEQDRVQRASAQLGWFADGRINGQRFADFFGTTSTLPAQHLVQIRYARHLLNETLMLGDDLHHVSVENDGDLGGAVRAALAALGRVFAAAHMINALREGRHADDLDPPLLAPLAPAYWTRAERALAPPLVVEVQGADLRPGGLEEMLQGAQKIVLLVSGEAPPAALVRLISPGVLVVQTTDLADLARLTVFDGPAVAAVLPEGAARFVWEPGVNGRGRLVVQQLPKVEPRRRIGRITAFQQTEELRWLQRLSSDFALAEERASATVASASSAIEPGDQLAAWLLRQVELP
jgi:hypothetical protein